MNDTASHPSYQVIARRYRPRFFHEVAGQKAIADTLKQAIEKDRLAHAYLFCGPRGVGKTSMARIFARALQCPNARSNTEGGVEACDKCDVCERVFRGEDFDVVEMDGASHRGIDDIRDLIQAVRFAPSSGTYRIFIIDEVHMLTREAFNALLKTLEEPPAHVKFVFATTEPEKILPTVLSRVQRCDFSAISPADIVLRLQQICEAENAQPEPGLLERVADLARGGMRDSQSLLDQLLSFAGNTPTQDDLNRITGRMSPARVSELVDLIDGGERSGVVTQLMEIESSGTDSAVVLEQVVEQVRQRLHDGVMAGWGDAEIERNLLAQEILQEARWRMKQVGRSEIILEVALLRASTLHDLIPLGQWADRLDGDGPPPRPTRPSGPANSGPANSGPANSGPANSGPANSGGPSGGSSAPRGGGAPGRRPASGGSDRASGTSSAPRGDVEQTSEVRRSESDRAPMARSAENPTNGSPENGTPDPPGRRPAVAVDHASPPPAHTTDQQATAEQATAEQDSQRPNLAGVQECLSRVSAMMAGIVGDRISVDGQRVRFSLDSSAQRLVQPKVEDLRAELRRTYGDGFTIELETATSSELGTSTPAESHATAVAAPSDRAPAAANLNGQPGPESFSNDFPMEPDFEDGGVPAASEPVDHEPVRPVGTPAAAETPVIVEKAVEIFAGRLHSHRPPLDPDQLAR